MANSVYYITDTPTQTNTLRRRHAKIVAEISENVYKIQENESVENNNRNRMIENEKTHVSTDTLTYKVTYKVS